LTHHTYFFGLFALGAASWCFAELACFQILKPMGGFLSVEVKLCYDDWGGSCWTSKQVRNTNRHIEEQSILSVVRFRHAVCLCPMVVVDRCRSNL
jgi:hypothetical protein